MATKRLTIDGYGQVELNNVAFRRDGRIEAQCAANAEDFADGIENGMLVAIDDLNHEVVLAKEDNKLPIGLVYSTEHLYDERLVGGLKHFKLNAENDFLPRIGYLAVGDKFRTNCIAYDDATYTDDEGLIKALNDIATTSLYGGVSDNGAILIGAAKPDTGVVLKVVAKDTMPDGQLGIKFQVIEA